MFENLHLTIINSAIIYIFIIAGIRLLGKKELGQLSVADLVFIMLISEAVGDVLRASNETIMGGLVAALTLMIVNKGFKLASYKSPKFSALMEGHPSVILRDGVPNKKEMSLNKVNLAEIEQAAREHGIADISKVKIAILEKDGNVSILDENHFRSSEEIHE